MKVRNCETENTPQLDLPIRRARAGGAVFRAARRAFVFPGDLSAAARRLSERTEVPLPLILLAALHSVLGRYSRQERVAITVLDTSGKMSEPISSHAQQSCADLSGEPSFRELLRRLQQPAAAGKTELFRRMAMPPASARR